MTCERMPGELPGAREHCERGYSEGITFCEHGLEATECERCEVIPFEFKLTSRELEAVTLHANARGITVTQALTNLWARAMADAINQTRLAGDAGDEPRGILGELTDEELADLRRSTADLEGRKP